jgi:glycosyltransferase involved in cell wall biosynthesis
MKNKPEKTKVLFVITKSNFGGAQKYVFDLATSLPQDSFEAVVALGGNGLLAEKLHQTGIRTIPISSLTRDVNPSGDTKTFSTLLDIFKAEKPDVVHLNSSKIGIMGGLAARLAGIPKIIFTAHGWAFNENRSWISRFIIKILSWVTVLISHKTIAVSDAIARDMHWVGAPRKMTVIKNGIQPIDFVPKKDARDFLNTLSPINIPQDAFVFGSTAELHPSKGLAYAINAFAHVLKENPNIYYVIFGEGQERKNLTELIQKKELMKRVILLGFVDGAPKYLKALDCFVLPSTTEALGLAILEAGLAELPVIATNTGGIPEIVEDQKTGLLVPSKNTEALSLAFFQILESTTTQAGLGSTLEEKVLKLFSFEKTLSTTISLYNKN